MAMESFHREQRFFHSSRDRAIIMEHLLTRWRKLSVPLFELDAYWRIATTTF